MKKKLLKIVNFIRILVTVWGFLVAILFAANGIPFLSDKRYVLAAIIFAIALGYIIVLSISLSLSLEAKRTKKETKNLRNFNFFKKILKLVILVLTVVLSTNIFDVNTLIRRMNIAWVIITILFDIAHYTLSIIIKRFKDAFEEGK